MFYEGKSHIGPLIASAIRLLNFEVTKFIGLLNLFRGDIFCIAKPPTRDRDQKCLNKFSNPISRLFMFNVCSWDKHWAAVCKDGANI